MKKIMRSVWIGGLVLGALLAACATDDSESEKMLVFQKFIQATDAKAQYKQMMNVITAQAHNQFSSQLREQYRIFDVADPEKQNQIQGILKEARKVFQSKFKTQMTKLIPFSEIKNSIFYPLYMNHFNTSELKSIVAFYESPAGKKLVTLTPRLMQDTMIFFNRKYGPRLNELSRSIASEEMKKIKPALQKIKDL